MTQQDPLVPAHIASELRSVWQYFHEVGRDAQTLRHKYIFCGHYPISLERRPEWSDRSTDSDEFCVSPPDSLGLSRTVSLFSDPRSPDDLRRFLQWSETACNCVRRLADTQPSDQPSLLESLRITGQHLSARPWVNTLYALAATAQILDVDLAWSFTLAQAAYGDTSLIRNVFTQRRTQQELWSFLKTGRDKLPGYSDYEVELTLGLKPDVYRASRTAIEFLAATFKVDLQPVAPRPDNILEKSGKDWKVAFAGGETVLIKGSPGMFYIACLLEHPGDSFPASELRANWNSQKANPSPTYSRSVRSKEMLSDSQTNAGPILDRKALEGIDLKCRELRADMDQAERSGNEVWGAELKEELNQILKHRASAFAPGGLQRVLASTLKKDRDQVSVSLDRAKEAIRSKSMPLAAHLHKSIVQDANMFTYRPYPPITWNS